jgi:hypothetical protein
METFKRFESVSEDGSMHLVEEYRWKRCKSILVKDLGEVAPAREWHSRVVEAELSN